MTFATGRTIGCRKTMVVVEEEEAGDVTPSWQIRVLGPIDLLTPSGPVSIGGRRPRMLIGALSIAATRTVAIDHLLDVLWGDDPPASAINTLHSNISRLRAVLGSDAIRLVDHSYRLGVCVENLDALEFERLIRAAGEDECPPARARDLCHRALALWRGSPFGDLGDVDPFRLEAIRLDELRLIAMETQLEAEMAMNHPELVIGALESAVRESPYRERLWFLLIEALAKAGRRVEALRACTELRELLGEVGLDGGPTLTALEDRIVQGLDS